MQGKPRRVTRWDQAHRNRSKRIFSSGHPPKIEPQSAMSCPGRGLEKRVDGHRATSVANPLQRVETSVGGDRGRTSCSPKEAHQDTIHTRFSVRPLKTSRPPLKYRQDTARTFPTSGHIV